MSARMRGAKANEEFSRRMRLGKGFARGADFLFRLLLGTAVVALIACLALGARVLNGEDVASSSLWFLQCAVEMGLWGAVVYQLRRLFEDALNGGTPFSSEASRRLSRAALLFLLLALSGLAFSMLVGWLAGGSVPSIGFCMGYAGFPLGESWNGLLPSTGDLQERAHVVIGLGPFLIPAVFAFLSHAFAYGRVLQDEADRTI